MKHYKINPKTVGVYTSNGKYLTDKDKSYPESFWKGNKASELEARGFLVEDTNPQPKVKAKKVEVAEEPPVLDENPPAEEEKSKSKKK